LPDRKQSSIGFRVAVLDPTELRAAVGEGSRFAGVTRQSYGRFDRTFSAAHDQDLLVDVVIGLDQPEHHFGRARRLPEGRGSCH